MTTKDLKRRVQSRAAATPKLSIENRPIEQIHPYLGNPRTHTPKQVRRIADSIGEFGFTNPILVDEHDIIIAGHGRLEAAKLRGLTHVPVICIAGLSAAQRKALLIADNRLAEKGSGWHRSALALEFDAILELDCSFDLELTGFDADEIELIEDAAFNAAGDEAEDLVTPASGPPVTVVGDVWDIGPHRLVCGDATKRETYQALLGRSRAAMVITDPPYNVPIHGHVSGLGRNRHREFLQASGEMTEAEFSRFLMSSFTCMAKFSRNGSLHYIFMDWANQYALQSAGRAVYDELKAICIWNKTNAGMGSLYRSQHEMVFVFKHGSASHINNVELGKHGRHRSNVWTFAGANSFSATRDADLAAHPTVKPTALIADAILDASKRGDIILDPFGGSGTTLLAAHQCERVARLAELDPLYCDLIIRRAEAATSTTAIHTETGRTFQEMSATRGEGVSRG